MMCLCLLELIKKRNERKMICSRPFINHASRLHCLDSIIGNGDLQCVHQLSMDRQTFGLLCELLRSRGKVKGDDLVTVEDQVCMFLHILSHHVKNRTISSRYFNSVVKGVLGLQSILLRAPKPVPENCADGMWKWFKNCLGALDGTYIRVRVPKNDKPRYRTRKGEIATNVLGVCSRDMKFIFVMPGWEGSAFDSRILCDAINKLTSSRVPTSYYYLVDVRYSNAEGFLAPYRGTRYHLSEWRDGPSFYQIKTQCYIITACCLLHNLIRREMSVDPLEHELLEIDNNEVQDANNITTLEASDQWTGWRNDLADAMCNEWLENHG
ncbi:DDE Tnp4 domain-containing protein [Citrus sinensis]|uniref:DDE Tnp4 domain-containing protein n=1 Tax=Citrus sinensis TaxID=2711 RepID=A0ACB8I2D2_CITSI|nr:DDE Tnp4 domain-containing protein [Citrus sinensis]